MIVNSAHSLERGEQSGDGDDYWLQKGKERDAGRCRKMQEVSLWWPIDDRIPQEVKGPKLKSLAGSKV